ncbi:DUF4260 domain-containing protein [Kerstersia gyiorum]|nr:DUF4260 family protein [Kerstersia gyiorum]MCR4159401.1 DUF4260 domain-containing protein [Kerstersia gyiorum]
MPGRRLFFDVPGLIAAGLIWTAHIGFDRALGYGLKYGQGFRLAARKTKTPKPGNGFRRHAIRNRRSPAATTPWGQPATTSSLAMPRASVFCPASRK